MITSAEDTAPYVTITESNGKFYACVMRWDRAQDRWVPEQMQRKGTKEQAVGKAELLGKSLGLEVRL